MSAISFGQDILVKRDSSKIEAKVLEIRPAEIKYKYFNYLDGPTLVVHKNEVAYIIYQNGQSEAFQIVIPKATKQTTAITYIDLYQARKDSIKKAAKLSDYLTLNIEAGLVMNDSYVNKPRADSKNLGSPGTPEYENYTQSVRSQMKYGYSIGLNFLVGKSPFCKYLTGINYLNSTGEFNYEHTGSNYHGLYYYKTANYRSTVHYINLLTGIRFIICKRLCIDNMLLLNIPVKTDNTLNGYKKSGSSSYSAETHYYVNEMAHDSKVGVTVSFAPRLSYEFKIKQQKLGIYASYNVSYLYNLPWCMAGLSYYPFKKLR